MPGATPLPAHLPRREEIIVVEGEERLCVCCGEERCIRAGKPPMLDTLEQNIAAFLYRQSWPDAAICVFFSRILTAVQGIQVTAQKSFSASYALRSLPAWESPLRLGGVAPRMAQSGPLRSRSASQTSSSRIE